MNQMFGVSAKSALHDPVNISPEIYVIAWPSTPKAPHAIAFSGGQIYANVRLRIEKENAR